MPIYEYRCAACGHELEALQKVSEAPLVKCPQCNADALAKQLSVAGFQLKGSGWYATDFKNSGKKPAAGNGAKANGSDAATATESTAKSGEATPASGGESATASTGHACGSGGCSSCS